MVERDGEHEFLRSYLADRDVRCPQCEYNLRDLTGDVCPECGERVELGLQLVEPRQAAPIAGLIGLCAGAGFNGLIVVFVLITLQIRRGIGLHIWDWIVLFDFTGFVVLGGIAAAWLRGWRWVRTREKRMRWTLVALCWLLTLIDIVWFSMTVR